MEEKIDPDDMISFKELFTSNVFEQEALINILDRKGIITKAEVLEEIKRLREMYKAPIE
jgi:hypothetical protein